MKILKILLIILLSLGFSQLKSEEKKNQLEIKILKNIRCLICQGQSVYDSESEFALSIKQTVKRKINDGLREDQIYEFLRVKYGDWIIYHPKFNKNTYFIIIWRI